MGAANNPHGPPRVPKQAAKGDQEAGCKGKDGGAPVVAVHGANGSPTVWQIANGGYAAPWHGSIMFVVWNPDRGVFLPFWQRPRWRAPGGAGLRFRRILLAEDVSPRKVRAVPSVGVGVCPDILSNQGAQRLEREVVGLGFARRRSCAGGVWPFTKWAGMQVGEARAAEPVQHFSAAAAEVMPKERAVVVVDYFPADIARVPGCPRMWGFTGGHPEEGYRWWDHRVTF